MPLLLLIIAALATWRVSSLLARERGFFAFGVGVRGVFGIEHEPDGAPSFDEDGEIALRPVTSSARIDALLHEIAQGLVCVWCNSLWVAAGVTLMLAPRFDRFDAGTFLLMTLALSASAILIDRFVEGG